jgi:hypothetical protein
MKSHIFLKNAQPKKTKHRNLLFQIDEKELVGGAGFRAQRLVTTTGRDNQLVQMEERRPLCHGFDDGLQLCSSLDSPPDLHDIFIEFAYFVNIDEMKLLVYSGSLQYFELSLTDVTIGDGWIEQLETGEIPYCNLPHPATFLETAIAAMSERGYVFKQWISKRSIENVIGEFIRHDSEQSVAVKLFFGESLLRGDDCAWRRRPAPGVLCCKREQAVAELLLESQAACVNHPRSIVPIVEIIHRGSSVHDVAGVVLYRAPSDLDCYFAEAESIVPITGKQPATRLVRWSSCRRCWHA